MKRNHRSIAVAALLSIITLTAAGAAQNNPVAQTTTMAAQEQAVVTETASEPEVPDTETDSHRVRGELARLLSRHPPEVGAVLKLDPALWTNPSYLSNYPSLAAFATAHPEVTHSPAFYLEDIRMPSDGPPEPAAHRMWRDMMEGMMIAFSMLFICGVMIWMIRTLIDHRRWSRLTRVQSEVHNKLLDRFASNDDLLRYVETSAGRRFLQGAPLSVDVESRPLGAPVMRILWSIQIGVVLAAAGIGLRIAGWTGPAELGQPFGVLGTVAMAIGAGFIASAAASYLVSRKLGLWESPGSSLTAGIREEAPSEM